MSVWTADENDNNFYRAIFFLLLLLCLRFVCLNCNFLVKMLRALSRLSVTSQRSFFMLRNKESNLHHSLQSVVRHEELSRSFCQSQTTLQKKMYCSESLRKRLCFFFANIFLVIQDICDLYK